MYSCIRCDDAKDPPEHSQRTDRSPCTPREARAGNLQGPPLTRMARVAVLLVAAVCAVYTATAFQQIGVYNPRRPAPVPRRLPPRPSAPLHARGSTRSTGEQTKSKLPKMANAFRQAVFGRDQKKAQPSPLPPPLPPPRAYPAVREVATQVAVAPSAAAAVERPLDAPKELSLGAFPCRL